MAPRQKDTAASRYVFANTTCGCSDGQGMTYQIIAGLPWAADDPLVLANPGLFAEEPPEPFPLRTVPA